MEANNKQFFHFNEYKIYYEDYGKGQPVLFLHGWGGRIDSMKPLIYKLSPERFRSILVDLPGFGQSSMPNSVIGSFDYVDIIYNLIKHLNLSKPFIVGHSFGGKLALLLSSKYPGSINKMVITSASGIRLPPTIKQRIKRSIAKIGKFAEKYLGSIGKNIKYKLYKYIASNDYLNAGQMKNIFLRVVNEDIRDELPKISIPTLLIWGDKDVDTKVECGKIMNKLIPDSGLVLLKDTTHFAYIEQIDQFMIIVNNFFKSHTGEDGDI